MKSDNDNQSQFPPQPLVQPGRDGSGVTQKPKRRRIRTYDKILNDPFVLTC